MQATLNRNTPPDPNYLHSNLIVEQEHYMQSIFKMVAASNNNNMDKIRNIETLINEFNDNATKDVDRFLSAFTNLLTLASSSEDNLKVIAAGVRIELLFNALSEAKIGSRLSQPQNKSVLSDLCQFLRLVLTRFDPVDVFVKHENYIIESLSETAVEEYH